MHTISSDIARLCDSIPPADATAARAVQDRLDCLAKPRGSLGALESVLVRLAASSGQLYPTVAPVVILLAAADHGVATEGVSAYPQHITALMVENFLAGGAAIAVLARQTGARLLVVDAGVRGQVPEHPALQRLNIRQGSGNIAREPAMQWHEMLAAVRAGIALVETAHQQGMHLFIPAEMGIGNTTPAAALTSIYTGAPATETVGAGSGLTVAQQQHKQAVVVRALDRAAVSALASPWHVLAELGGLEIAVLVGAILAAAARRVPVLLDGYISTSAALVAAAAAPNVTAHLLAAHCGAEPGHRLALRQLRLDTQHGAPPLLHLNLRLGEGAGAALAVPLLHNGIALLQQMALLDDDPLLDSTP